MSLCMYVFRNTLHNDTSELDALHKQEDNLMSVGFAYDILDTPKSVLCSK